MHCLSDGAFLRCYFIDVTIRILSGKNEENKSMKKAKRCLIAVVSGVLVASAVLSGCGQSKKEVSIKMCIRDRDMFMMGRSNRSRFLLPTVCCLRVTYVLPTPTLRRHSTAILNNRFAL